MGFQTACTSLGSLGGFIEISLCKVPRHYSWHLWVIRTLAVMELRVLSTRTNHIHTRALWFSMMATYIASRFPSSQTGLQSFACPCPFGHRRKYFSRMDLSYWNCWMEDDARFRLKRSARLPSKNGVPTHASAKTRWGCFPTRLPALGIISHFNFFPSDRQMLYLTVV